MLPENQNPQNNQVPQARGWEPQKFIAPVKTGDRECKLILGIGEKAGGKSFETIRWLIEQYVNVPAGGKGSPRRGLVLDVNDEFSHYNIPAILPCDIPIFTTHPKFELRRVRPFYMAPKIIPKDKTFKDIIRMRPQPDWIAKKMSLDELLFTMDYILEVFRGGMFLMEDISRLVRDSVNQDLAGAIASNRHQDCDLMMHYQSLSRPLPRIWENTDLVRFHHQKEDVYKAEKKVTNIDMYRVAQLIVNEKFRNGNQYFFVWIDRGKNKIYGDFTGQDLSKALEVFLAENGRRYVRTVAESVNQQGKKIYSYHEAFKKVLIEQFVTYWGNTPIDMAKAQSIFR